MPKKVEQQQQQVLAFILELEQKQRIRDPTFYAFAYHPNMAGDAG